MDAEKELFLQELNKCIQKSEDRSLAIEDRQFYLEQASIWADKINDLEKTKSSNKWRAIEVTGTIIGSCFIPLTLELIKNNFIKTWGKKVANFEKNYTWTTSPGKAISSGSILKP